MKNLLAMIRYCHESHIYNKDEYESLEKLITNCALAQDILNAIIQLYKVRLNKQMPCTMTPKAEVAILGGICQNDEAFNSVATPWTMLIVGMNIELQRRVGLALLLTTTDKGINKGYYDKIITCPPLNPILLLPKRILKRLLIFQMMVDDFGCELFFHLFSESMAKLPEEDFKKLWTKTTDEEFEQSWAFLTEAEKAYFQKAETYRDMLRAHTEKSSINLSTSDGIKQFFTERGMRKGYLAALKLSYKMLLTFTQPVFEQYCKYKTIDESAFVAVRDCFKLESAIATTIFLDENTFVGDMSEHGEQVKLRRDFCRSVKADLEDRAN